jgi:drug/metabolite transporter (DMT)-like permease
VSENTPPSSTSGAPAAPGSADPRTWLAFAGCCVIWGSTFLVISIGNDALAPLWAAALRLGLAALILFPLSLLAGQRIRDRASLASALRYGLLQMGINFALLYWGEKTVPSGIAAVCYATTPLSSALMASALRIERMSWLKLLGAGVALAGVAMIGRGSGSVHTPLPGFLAILGAATVAALGNTLLKRGPRVPALAVNAVGCAVGCAICLTLSRLIGEPWVVPREPVALFSIIYLTIAGSVGAFVLMTWLVMRWPVTRVSFVSVVVPVVAMALGAVFRHEPLTVASLAGSALVLAGWGCGLASDAQAARAGTSSGH